MAVFGTLVGAVWVRISARAIPPRQAMPAMLLAMTVGGALGGAMGGGLSAIFCHPGHVLHEAMSGAAGAGAVGLVVGPIFGAFLGRRLRLSETKQP